MSAKTPRARWALWGLLLAGAAALAVFGDKTPAGAGAAPAVRAAASGPARPAPVRNTKAPEPIEPLLPRELQASAALPPRADLFATPAWRRPPAPAPAAAAAPASAPPPPPPQAPPLPYRVIGRKFDGQAWELFLGRDDTPFVVRQGDTLEGAWQVQKIAPPLATLRHLATGQERSLEIGPSP